MISRVIIAHRRKVTRDCSMRVSISRNGKFPSRDDTKSQSKNDQAPSFAVIHSTGEKFAAAAATIPRAISRAVIDIRARARVDQSYFCRSGGTMTRTWNVAIRDSFPRRNSGIRGYSARVELTSLATLLFVVRCNLRSGRKAYEIERGCAREQRQICVYEEDARAHWYTEPPT